MKAGSILILLLMFSVSGMTAQKKQKPWVPNENQKDFISRLNNDMVNLNGDYGDLYLQAYSRDGSDWQTASKRAEEGLYDWRNLPDLLYVVKKRCGPRAQKNMFPSLDEADRQFLIGQSEEELTALGKKYADYLNRVSSQPRN